MAKYKWNIKVDKHSGEIELEDSAYEPMICEAIKNYILLNNMNVTYEKIEEIVLLPCPICGREAKLNEPSMNVGWLIRCTGDFHGIMCESNEKKEVIEAWNTRHTKKIPVKYDPDKNNYVCPVCSENLYATQEFCSCCGVELDWQEEWDYLDD